tara:strand:+ start:154 stop:414 length:261 start_codon:yes stop_codon:yes gene_type:complete
MVPMHGVRFPVNLTGIRVATGVVVVLVATFQRIGCVLGVKKCLVVLVLSGIFLLVILQAGQLNEEQRLGLQQMRDGAQEQSPGLLE